MIELYFLILQRLNTLKVSNQQEREKVLIPTTSIQTTNATEIVTILTTIKDRNTITIKTVNFRMARPTALQDTVITTSVVTEEADSIVAVEDRTMLISVITHIVHKATIVVENVKGGVVATLKVPIVEGTAMEKMKDATKMVNRNHIQTQFKKLV